MSVLRIKIVYEDDIRMFKAKSDTEELLNKVILFVKEAHDLETFRLVFKDDEGDEITIVDDDDLKEALNNNNNKKTTKLYVKANGGKKDEEEKESEEVLTSNIDEYENDNRTGENSEEEEETEDENNFVRGRCKWLKFLDDISEDKELKEEFINFLTTFLVSLQNMEENEDDEENPGTLNNGSELFIQALSLHPKLNKHEAMSKFVSEKLDSLFYQFPHLLNILKQINVDDIPKFIDLIIDFNNNNKNSPKSNNFPMLPPFLFPFLGLFNCKYRCNNRQGVAPPPFGLPPSFWGNMFGGFGGRHRHHRGRHHGGRHHRGHHGHGFGHGHHGHHGHGRRFHGGRGGCRRGGMRKQCGRGFFNQSFFEEMNNNTNNNFEKCKKHKDLRADIIDENITLGKNAFVSGNQTLIKTWKMKNVGKKTIPANCTIQYFGRKFNLMIDGTKFELKNKEIQVNEEFEVSVVVKSPKENGNYKSKWKLVTPDGSKFGQPLIVSFIVNDFNDFNKKEFKKLRKEEKKNFKKQQKFLRKEEKLQRKEEKLQNKKEKLRNKREKLLQKLQLLKQQSDELDNNSTNNDDKDDVKEEIIQENNQNNDNDNDNNNNNNIDLDEDEIVIIDENDNNNDNDNENKVTLEGDEDKFIYAVQLEQLKMMGFNDENQLKQLLQINNGSVEAVLNSIM